MPCSDVDRVPFIHDRCRDRTRDLRARHTISCSISACRAIAHGAKVARTGAASASSFTAGPVAEVSTVAACAGEVAAPAAGAAAAVAVAAVVAALTASLRKWYLRVQ